MCKRLTSYLLVDVLELILILTKICYYLTPSMICMGVNRGPNISANPLRIVEVLKFPP